MPKLPTFQSCQCSKKVLSSNAETKLGRKYAKQYTGLSGALKKAEGAARVAKMCALKALKADPEWSTFTEETHQEKEQEVIKRIMMELDKKNLKLNEEWKEKTGKEENQAYSQGIDEDTNDSSSDSSDFDVKEDGLDEDEYVDDAGKSITADQVRETLAAVLKKHQEKLNQDLQDMAQKGSFEEEGVLLSEEEIVEENDGEESE